MAVTKIWDIKGWVGKVVSYVENPDKTSIDATIEYAMTDDRAKGLNHVIDYAADGAKTEQHHYVSALNCAPDTAREEMMLTKKAWGKLDGITAFHGYQAFKPGEATPSTAHEIGVRLAQELWGERFEVVITTHLDKEHIHNHFVLNSVSFIDGRKFYDNKESYNRMREASDRLCLEHNLSIVERPKRGRTKHYAEYRAEQENRPTWRGTIKAEIDEAISQSMTENQFFTNLKKRGYEVKLGKYISVRPPGKERFFRLQSNFGDSYSRDGIIRQMRGRRPVFPDRRAAGGNVARGAGRRVVKLKGSVKTAKKLTGFRALYFHYLYLMGKLPKKRPRPPAKVHFLFREDIIHIDKISSEITLLYRNRIDSSEQLFSYKQGLVKRIETLTAERTELRKELRRARDEPLQAEIKAKIALMSKGLDEARKEAGLCGDIVERSGVMREKRRTAVKERGFKVREMLRAKPRRDVKIRTREM